MKINKLSTIENPIASWLICSHLTNSMLFESIDSCFNQSHNDFEIIFVCNGENREKIAKDLSDRYVNEKRLTIIISNLKYLTHSLNLGLEMCRAEYVVRMDADDICRPDRLKIQLDYMNKNPDVCVLGSSYQIINENGNIGNVVQLPSNNKDIRNQLHWRNPICHPSVVYRKEIICMFGGYMGSEHAEDYDLWIRLSQDKSIKFAAIEVPLLYYRSVSTSNTRKSVNAYAGMLSSQARLFLITLNPIWIISISVSIIKSLFWRIPKRK
jgi:glycosyltransferase involved in cell wall biosynthesis